MLFVPVKTNFRGQEKNIEIIMDIITLIVPGFTKYKIRLFYFNETQKKPLYSYFGSYCEWTYGKGPLENKEPVWKNKFKENPEISLFKSRRDTNEGIDPQLGAGKQAAFYLGKKLKSDREK